VQQIIPVTAAEMVPVIAAAEWFIAVAGKAACAVCLGHT
jgi:hypothetical protein